MKEKNCFWYLEVFKNCSQKLFFIIGFLKCFKPVFDGLICSINLSHISCRLTRKLIWASSRDHTHSPCLRNKLWEREKKKGKKRKKNPFQWSEYNFGWTIENLKLHVQDSFRRILFPGRVFLWWLISLLIFSFLFLFLFSFFDDVYYCGLS